jgi:hypothetical protein
MDACGAGVLRSLERRGLLGVRRLSKAIARTRVKRAR